MGEAFLTRRGGGAASGGVKGAVIGVTFPVGATVSVSNGTKTYTSKDTDGNTAFIVEAGTWTVTATDGVDSDSKEVTVEEKDFTSVELTFWNGELYVAGREYESVTGGWQARGWKYDSGGKALAPTLTKNETSMTMTISGSVSGGIVEIAKDVNLNEWNEIVVIVESLTKSLTGQAAERTSLVVTDRTETYGSSRVAQKAINSFVVGENVLDISSVNGNYDIGFYLYVGSINMTVTEVFLRK